MSCLFLALLGLASAGTWQAGFRVGVEGGGVRDDLLASLGYGGAGPRIGGTLDVGAGPVDLSVDLGGGVRLLANRFGHIAAAVDHQVDVAATWRAGGGPWTGGVGLAAAWDARMSYFTRWDDAHGYWLGAQWLGPAGRVGGPVGRTDLELGLAFAVIGGAGRPPEYHWRKQEPLRQPGYWFSAPVQNERFYAIDQLQAVRLEGTVTLPGTGHGRWQVGLDTRLVHIDEPATAIDVAATAYFGRVWGNR